MRIKRVIRQRERKRVILFLWITYGNDSFHKEMEHPHCYSRTIGGRANLSFCVERLFKGL